MSNFVILPGFNHLAKSCENWTLLHQIFNLPEKSD